MTEVYFLWEKPVKGEIKSVFAYFPNLLGAKRRTGLSYARIGQHSDCHPEYAAECRDASFNEYCHTLLPELISIGYKDLRILNKETFSYWRKPTPEEVKFGHGAHHHKAILLADCINPKTGKIKKWLVADDGLRYYY